MKNPTNLYKRHRFPSEIIQHAVWLYYRFNLSSRDIEDLLAERGVVVSYESIRLLDCELLRLGKVWQQPDVRADRFPFGLKS